MTRLADVESFIQQVKPIESFKALSGVLADVTAEMGFDHYALSHRIGTSAAPALLGLLAGRKPDQSYALGYQQRTDDMAIALGNYPGAWVEQYFTRKLMAHDPIHSASQRTRFGFFWDDLPKLMDLSAAQRETHEMMLSKSGVGQGYSIPAHFPGGVSGRTSFAMRTGRSFPEHNLAMAQFIATFAFQVAKTIAVPQLDQRPFEAMTPRQLECLALVARGKSDWEIGRILNIGQESVKHHIKLVRENYNVPTRIQAVVRAVFDGHLPIKDIIR